MSVLPGASPGALRQRVDRLRTRWQAVLALGLVTRVGLVAFGWPFLASPGAGLAHGHDAPWLFALLIGLLAVVTLAEVAAGGLDAKAIALLGVLAAVGWRAAGARRRDRRAGADVLPARRWPVGCSAAGSGFVLGALAIVTAARSSPVGSARGLPFQMITAGWVGLGAAPAPPGVRPARAGDARGVRRWSPACSTAP